MFSKPLLLATLALGTAACVMSRPAARAGQGEWLDQTGVACCPVCDKICKLEAEQTETERTCFEVETELVCIPRVVFPWQTKRKPTCADCRSGSGSACTNCVHNGARVRKVRVLKPKTYTCPACEYCWSTAAVDCGGCGPTGCDHGGCDAATVAVPGLIEADSEAAPDPLPLLAVPPAPRAEGSDQLLEKGADPKNAGRLAPFRYRF
jgi:hypothetical protein